MKNHRGRNKSQNRVMKDPHARSATDRDGRVIAMAFESARDRNPDRSILFFFFFFLQSWIFRLEVTE